jgi:uncharacterized membrane protein (UPF0127 family)
LKTYTALCGGEEIARRVRVADGFLSRFVGLMGKRSLPRDEGLLIRRCSQVHSFNMRFTIDVVFVNECGVVMRTVPSFRPRRISPLVRGAASALELAQGSIAAHGIRVGSSILFVPPQEGNR